MIKRITTQDCIVLLELIVGAIMMIIGCAVWNRPIPSKPTRIVYLKTGGDFTNYCRVADVTNYDRVLNMDNVAVMRKVENKRLEIDGRVVILFKDNNEREKFILGGDNNDK